MSIILEALKKVTEDRRVLYAKTKRQVQESKIKNEKNKDSVSGKANPIFNIPVLVFAAILAAGAILLPFALKINDSADTKTRNITASPKTTTDYELGVSAEGYTPPTGAQEQICPKNRINNIFKPKNSLPKLTLNGIISGIGEPNAIIENKIIGEGESIKGAKILRIYPDKVELSNEISGEIFTLNLH
ncbi:MAG: hypothetical protein V1933_03075 [Candidatus Omnitrophota bacterium]